MRVFCTAGRYTPLHWGHINYFKWSINQSDLFVVCIGSCYEVGLPRHPFLAFLREKMILNSLISCGIDTSKVVFVHLQDYNHFNEWWNDITEIAKKYGVTDFLTGNEEDILSQVRESNIDIPFSFINPETQMPKKLSFPYHASDLRKAVLAGGYDLFKKIAAPGTIALMSHVGGFNGLRKAMKSNATVFVPGRQSVDMVIVLREGGNEPKILCGYRSNPDKGFYGQLGLPGDAIFKYENPMDAAVRALQDKTGIKVSIVARHLEPAHVHINEKLFDMRFLRLFSNENIEFAGTQGGSSQPFCIEIDSPIACLNDSSELSDIAYRPLGELTEKGMAYQQLEMVIKAIT